MTYELSEDLKKLGDICIEKYPELQIAKGARVIYLWSNLTKKKVWKRVFAECMKAPKITQELMHVDFFIIFYRKTCEYMDDEQLEMLMRHELMHIGISSSGTWNIQPHDVEDFRIMIEEHGIDWSAPGTIGERVVEKYKKEEDQSEK